jgi:hypothetical protein
MKKNKTGDARGRRSWGSSFLGNPGAAFCGGKRDPGRFSMQDLGETEEQG